jgi:hypothetical protein
MSALLLTAHSSRAGDPLTSIGRMPPVPDPAA